MWNPKSGATIKRLQSPGDYPRPRREYHGAGRDTSCLVSSPFPSLQREHARVPTSHTHRTWTRDKRASGSKNGGREDGVCGCRDHHAASSPRRPGPPGSGSSTAGPPTAAPAPPHQARGVLRQPHGLPGSQGQRVLPRPAGPLGERSRLQRRAAGDHATLPEAFTASPATKTQEHLCSRGSPRTTVSAHGGAPCPSAARSAAAPLYLAG